MNLRLTIHNSHVLLDLCVVEPPPDEPLGGVERVLGVGHGLTLGGHASKALALCEDIKFQQLCFTSNQY